MELYSGLQLGKRIRHIGRLAQITNTFARYGLWSLAERLGVKSWLTPEQVRRAEELSKEGGGAKHVEAEKLPARLRHAFEELGPAFVKLGQLLAVREDILNEDFIAEFRKLHSDVASLPYKTIEDILLSELGSEKLAGFAEIDQTPLAAASIAQVHAAKLISGEDVVIKIQRPGISEQIEIDLSLMSELAGLLEKYVSETHFARPQAMMMEFKRAIQAELDFVREAGNLTKIRRNFVDQKHIVIPDVYWKLTTPKVLTMSLVDGIPAWDKDRIQLQKINPSLLCQRGMGMFLKMVFVDGLYHGDLHPGNLLALPGDNVGVLDFGLVVHLGRATRENLAGLLIALVHEDYERVVLHYMELADPALDFDAEAFEHEVGNAIAPFIGLRLEDMRSGKLFWELARIAARHGAPMPQELVVFVKTMVSFEGIGNHLDPGFDVLSSAESFTAEIASELYSPENLKHQALMIARDLGQLAKHAPFQMRRLLRGALEGELKLNVNSEEVSQLTLALDRSSARMAVSIIIGALIVGSSILTFARIGRELYSLSIFGLIGFGIAGVLAVYVIISILRGGKV